MKIVGICGSLRKKSFNRYALLAAGKMIPSNIDFEILDISEFPLYNEDIENEGFPLVVQDVSKKIKEADAILIASPEYNYSIPGVLKNAIDWLSRYPERPFDSKLTAIMSASAGMLGGARMQYHLRQVGVYLNLNIVNKPEVFITFAGKRFDDKGELLDNDTIKAIKSLVDELVYRIKQTD